MVSEETVLIQKRQNVAFSEWVFTVPGSRKVSAVQRYVTCHSERVLCWVTSRLLRVLALVF